MPFVSTCSSLGHSFVLLLLDIQIPCYHLLKKKILSPVLVASPFVSHQWAVYVWSDFWNFYSVAFVYGMCFFFKGQYHMF